jgi:putative FmdB family regulatory protein
MPLYPFRCFACGHEDDEYRKMGNYAPIEKCPKCGIFEYIKQITSPHTDLQEFHTPIEMMSVACNSLEEVREIQQKCPGVQIDDNPDSEMFGIPIAKNRKEKLAVLKAAGFREND